MAKRTIHMLIDDINGDQADETVTFGIDGKQYEIDLSKANAGKLRDVFAPYVGAGTRSGRSGATPARVAAGTGRGGGAVKTDREQNRAIRQWAQAKGLEVSDRGRIKQDIVDRYNAQAGH
jgi:hypothetical protein